MERINSIRILSDLALFDWEDLNLAFGESPSLDKMPPSWPEMERIFREKSKNNKANNTEAQLGLLKAHWEKSMGYSLAPGLAAVKIPWNFQSTVLIEFLKGAKNSIEWIKKTNTRAKSHIRFISAQLASLQANLRAKKILLHPNFRTLTKAAQVEKKKINKIFRDAFSRNLH
jgi:hypothetical protein